MHPEAPALPPQPETTTGDPRLPPRRSSVRHAVRVASFGLIGLLVVAAAMIAFLQTGPGTALLRDLALDAVGERLDGARVGSLDWSLGGDIVLRDLGVDSPDGAPIVAIAEVRVRPDWGSLLTVPTLEVDVTGLRVDVTRFPDGTDSLSRRLRRSLAAGAEPAPLPADLVISRLTLGDAGLSARTPEGATVKVDGLRLEASIALRLRSEGAVDVEVRQLSGDLRAEAPRTAGPGTLVYSAPMTASGRFEAGWPAESCVREGACPPPETPGGLAWPPPATAMLTLALDGTRGRVTAPRDVPFPIAAPDVRLTVADGRAELAVGRVDAGPFSLAGIAGHVAALDVAAAREMRLGLSGLAVSAEGLSTLVAALGGPAGVMKADLAGELTAEGPLSKPVVRGQLTWGDASVMLDGNAMLDRAERPKVTLQLTGKAIQPPRLLGLPNLPDFAAGFTLTLKADGVVPPDMRLDTSLHLDVLDPDRTEADSGDIEATVSPDALALQRIALKVLGQTVRVSGKASRTTRIFEADATATVDLARIATALAPQLSTPPPQAAGPDGAMTATLRVSGRLSPAGLALLEAAGSGETAEAPQSLGVGAFEALSLTSRLEADALRLGGGGSLDSASVDLDLKLVEGTPQGEARLDLKGLRTAPGAAPIDALGLRVTIDPRDGGRLLPLSGGWTGTARLGARALTLDGRFDVESVAAEASVDGLPPLGVLVSLDTVTVAGTPLAVTLAKPATLALNPKEASLRGLVLKLATAGPGKASALGEVRLEARIERAAGDDGAATGALSGRVEASGLALGQLARALGRPLPGPILALGPKLDLSAELTGRADAPEIAWSSRLRLPKRLSVSLDGRASADRLSAALVVGPSRDAPWLSGKLVLPLKRRDGRFEPDRQRPLAAEVTLQETSLARWRAALTAGDSARDDSDGLAGQLALGLTLGGTLANPEGTLEAAVAALSTGGAQAPLSSRLKLELAPGEAGGVRVGGTLAVDAAVGRLGGLTLLGEVARWTAGATPGWSGSARGDLDPVRLAQWMTPDGVRPADGSKIAFGLRGGGAGRRVSAELDWKVGLTGLAGTGAPFAALTAFWPLGLAGGVRLDDAGLSLHHTVTAGPRAEPLTTLEALARTEVGDLVTALAGGSLDAIRLEGRLSVPETSLARFAPPGLAGIPGTVGGALTLDGTAARPALTGALDWRGFPTLAGDAGRVAVTLATTPKALRLALSAGPAPKPVASASETTGGDGGGLRLDLTLPALSELFRVTPDASIPLAVSAFARTIPLRSLLPDLQALPRTLADAIGGVLDLEATAALTLKAGVPLLEALGGRVEFAGLSVPIPDTTRVLRDGRLALSLSPQAIRLEAAEVHEQDPGPGCSPCPTRTLRASGELGLGGTTGLVPTSLTARVEATDFLVGGLALDGPEAALDLDLAVAVPDLAARPLAATLTFEHLDLDAPDRFVRAHYPQFISHGDILEAPAEGNNPGGLPPLPVPRPLLPPIPPDLALAVGVVFPKPGRLAAFPLDVSLEGRLDVHVAQGTVTARGRLDVVRGVLGAMGWDLPFERGAITAEGPLDSGLLDLTFAVAPPDVALRDASREGGHGGLARITARASLARGLETRFSGVGGPNVLDMATFLNTGRTRLWGAPDLQPSSTVRFGNGDHGLVLTFIRTNLRDFIFMDRTLGWSDALVDHAAYGQLAWFEMQRTLPAGAHGEAGASRLWLRGRPVAPGLNRLELGWEWLLLNAPRQILGFGPRLGLDGHLGAAFGWEWSSVD